LHIQDKDEDDDKIPSANAVSNETDTKEAPKAAVAEEIPLASEVANSTDDETPVNILITLFQS